MDKGSSENPELELGGLRETAGDREKEKYT
jgi:hypothetical protein